MEVIQNEFHGAGAFAAGPGDSNITSRKQQPTRRVSTKQHSFLWIVLALVLIAVASQFAAAQLNVTKVQANSHLNAISAGLSKAASACAHGSGPLNPNVPPGCNFKLSIWSLQLPTGSPGNPTTISSSQLQNGFTDQFFFTGSDGAMDFFDPGVNCVTTANSKHCRSELREVSPAVWSSKGTNTLSATLKVTQAAGAPVVGQIHLDESVSVRPLIELFYTSGGDLVAGVEQCTAGGCETRTTVGHVNPGTRFSYVISYSHNKLTVSINGGPAHSLSTPLLGIGGYFKAGDYGQSPKAARISFYSLKAVHGS